MGLDDHYEKHLKYFPNPNHFKKDLELDLCSSGKAVTPHIQISPATVAAAASSPAGPSGAGFTSHPHPSGTENNPSNLPVYYNYYKIYHLAIINYSDTIWMSVRHGKSQQKTNRCLFLLRVAVLLDCDEGIA